MTPRPLVSWSPVGPTRAAPPAAHLGQQRVAHELQLVRGDVHRHVERGAQELPALILELHQQPLDVKPRRLLLRQQARRASVTPLGGEGPHFRLPPASGTPGRSAQTRRPRPHSRTPTATAAAILRPHVEEKSSGKTERRSRSLAAPQFRTSPSGVAEGKCHVVPGLGPWEWAHMVPRSTTSPWTGRCIHSQSLPVPCSIQTAFCLFRTGILAPFYRWGN